MIFARVYLRASLVDDQGTRCGVTASRQSLLAWIPRQRDDEIRGIPRDDIKSGRRWKKHVVGIGSDELGVGDREIPPREKGGGASRGHGRSLAM